MPSYLAIKEQLYKQRTSINLLFQTIKLINIQLFLVITSVLSRTKLLTLYNVIRIIRQDYKPKALMNC